MTEEESNAFKAFKSFKSSEGKTKKKSTLELKL